MNKLLKENADKARMLYRGNIISRKEAIKDIQPFIESYNTKSKEIAKKYNQRPKTISVISFLR